MWKRKNTLSILLALALLSSIGMACSGPNYGQDLLKTGTNLFYDRHNNNAKKCRRCNLSLLLSSHRL